MAPKVLIIGAGAIGGFYGSLLAKAGADVSVVCRSNFDFVKQHGFTIDSDLLGDLSFKPQQVLSRAENFSGSADYVVICTKIIPEINRAALLKAAVRKNTTIVFIQNGVEIEQELQDAFPENELISGLAFICCNQLSPGYIKHLAYGRLTLGNLATAPSKNILKLCGLFNQSGIECAASSDIICDRWKKCVWNAPFNPLSVLSGGLLTLDILTNQEPLVRCLMQEICNIAEACGHTLPADIIEFNIDSTYAIPPYKTSMLSDYEKGQPMETEAILGNAVRAAKRVGIACPHLETIYALMKLTEFKLKTVY